MPFSPKTTCSTAWSSASMVMTASDTLQTAAGVSATRAPSATRASAFSRLRLKTTTSWPARSRVRAMPEPIRHRSMNPTFITVRIIDRAGVRPLPTCYSCEAELLNPTDRTLVEWLRGPVFVGGIGNAKWHLSGFAAACASSGRGTIAGGSERSFSKGLRRLSSGCDCHGTAAHAGTVAREHQRDGRPRREGYRRGTCSHPGLPDYAVRPGFAQ